MTHLLAAFDAFEIFSFSRFIFVCLSVNKFSVCTIVFMPISLFVNDFSPNMVLILDCSVYIVN